MGPISGKVNEPGPGAATEAADPPRASMRGRGAARVSVGIVLCLLAGIGAAVVLARRHPLHPEQRPALLASLATLGLLLIPWAVLASGRAVRRLRDLTRERPALALALALGLLCPYFLYWAIPGNASLAGLLGLVAYAALPALLAVALPEGGGPGAGDALVVVAIWLPVEFRWLGGSFPWPPGGGGSFLLGPLGLDLLLYLMLVVRRTDGIGYSFRIGGRDLLAAVGAFASFAAVGVPIGLWTGFLSPGESAPHPLEMVLKSAVIFLFTAVPEETLFRGFIQGFLERWTSKPGLSLGVASVIFGVAHLNNGPVSDWRYFLLATLAGVAYGWVYRRSRRIMAPALTHMLVDATWALFLKG